MAAVTVLGESGTGILATRMQRNGDTEASLNALRQTIARDLVGIDVDGRHATLFLTLGIAVKKPLMRCHTEFQHEVVTTDGQLAADAQARKGSGMDQVHVGVTHVDGLVQFDRSGAVDVDLAEETHACLGTQGQIRLKILGDRQSELKRQTEVGIADVHRVMHVGAGEMLIADVGATLHIHGLRRDNEHATHRDLDEKPTHRSDGPSLRQLAQRLILEIIHPWEVDATLETDGKGLFLLYIVGAHLPL